MTYEEWKIKRMCEVHAILGPPKNPAPVFKAAQNTAESDPPVKSDCAGAGPHSNGNN